MRQVLVLLAGVALATFPCVVGAQASEPVEAAAAADRAREQALARLGQAVAFGTEFGPDVEVAALLPMVEDLHVSRDALRVLQGRLLRAPPRPAWAEAYERVVALLDGEEALALEVVAARAQAWSPRTRARAIERLQALRRRHPSNNDIRHALGEARLLSGDPDAALTAFGKQPQERDLADGAALAWLALGRTATARDLAPDLVAGDCASSSSVTACARVLVDNGYPLAAISLLERGLADATGADLAALHVRIAGLRTDVGDAAGAVRSWNAARRAAPDDPSILEGATRARLAVGDLDSARDLARRLGDGGLVEEVEGVRRALAVRDPSSDDPAVAEALERAWTFAPRDPRVAHARARWLVARGRPGEAMGVLEGGPLAAPSVSRETLDLYLWAAWEAHAPAPALQAALAALPRVESAEEWRHVVASVSAIAAAAAESEKAGRQYAAATRDYRLAHVLRPESVGPLLGLGGLLWDAGDPDGARTALETAHAMAPGNRQVLFTLVRFLGAHGWEEEASRVLATCGFTDPRVRWWQAEMETLVASRTARAAMAGGRYVEAVGAWELLAQHHPDRVLVLHGLADALAALGRYPEAAVRYEAARSIDPGDHWLLVGEASVRAAAGDLDRARTLLDLLDASADPGMTDAAARARGALQRAEADRAWREGDTSRAFELYADLRATEPRDVWTMVGLAGLYESAWQVEAAQTWYDETLAVDAWNDVATRGLVRTTLALGQDDAASRLCASLRSRSPTPDNLAACREVVRQLARREVLDLLQSLDGEPLPVDPPADLAGDEVIRATWATLLDRAGQPEDAWDLANRILDDNPLQEQALALLLDMGPRLGRSDRALSRFEAALPLGSGAFLDTGRRRLALAVDLDRAVAGDRSGAPALIERIVRDRAGADAESWVLAAGAWADLGELERAIEAYGVALGLSPGLPSAAAGLAGLLEASGQPDAAEDVLSDAWAVTGDFGTAKLLAALQTRRGRQRAARQTLAWGAAGGVPADPVPSPFPALSTPAGVTPPSRQVPPPSDPFRSWDAAGAVRETGGPSAVTGSLGAGVAWVPDTVVDYRLLATYQPLRLELALRDPHRLDLEVVPVEAWSGSTSAVGVAPSLGFVTALRERLGVQVRAGTTPLGFPGGTTFVGAGAATIRPIGGLEVEAQAARAPVVDTLASWAGTPAGVGFVTDNWGGLRAGWLWPRGANAGALGRVGATLGPAMDPSTFAQAVGWGRVPLRVRPTSRLDLGVDALYLGHGRSIAAVVPGEAGVFSPSAFLSSTVRLSGDVTPPSERVAACAGLGLGPRYTAAGSDLGAPGGWSLGWEGQAALSWRVTGPWHLVGQVIHRGGTAWSQTAGLLQVRVGSVAPAPSGTFASPVHGPPVGGLEGCSAAWSPDLPIRGPARNRALVDGDAVPGDADACPYSAEDLDGWQDEDGCLDPDNDADGVLDAADRCPGEKEDQDGSTDTDGCPDPDDDGDGLPDPEDACPGAAGPPVTRGCPDRDADGAADGADECPSVAGTAVGCPDWDGDGVPDLRDACPERKASTPGGCPARPSEADLEIDTVVHFGNGSVDLSAEAVVALRALAARLQAQPGILVVEVAGHASGEKNAEALSERRAQAVRAWLVDRGGIEARRLRVGGHGDARPVDAATTAEGRAMNRRVDFLLVKIADSLDQPGG